MGVRNTIVFACFISIFFWIMASCQRTTRHTDHSNEERRYTCPMHPQIVRDAPGACPICGMDLVRMESSGSKMVDDTLALLLGRTNAYAVATVPLTAVQYRHEPMKIEAAGYTVYNTSSVGTVSSRVSGRIERLYLRYRFEKVARGQKILDIYSPELLTAQENLLFLVRNDPANERMLHAAKQKILLLGMSRQQLDQVIRSNKPSYTMGVYSNYSGHLHEAVPADPSMQTSSSENIRMEDISQTTPELGVKEGMYLQKGQAIFSVYDPARLWGLLNIQQSDQAYIKPGNRVRLVSEADPDNEILTTISYIEPVLRTGSKTVTARVNINNTARRIPVGSQLHATIFSAAHTGWWLPREAVLSLGMEKVVFVKTRSGFEARKVVTGHVHPEWIQIVKGIGSDSVAANAQYLIDSESFIRAKEQ